MKVWAFAAIGLSAGVLAGGATMAQGGENDCTAWTAKVQEREEGPALTAMACAKTDTHDAIVEIVCFGEKANIRYIHAPDKGADEFGPKRDFLFITNKGRRSIFMTFEGLDGAFTAYLDKEHPLLALLMESRTLSVEDPTRRLRSQKITLKDSRDAIEAVISRCAVQPTEAAAAPCPEPTAASTEKPAPRAAGDAQRPASPAAGTVTGPADGATPRTSGATGLSGDKR